LAKLAIAATRACGEAGLYLPLDVAFDSRNDLYTCDPAVTASGKWIMRPASSLQSSARQHGVQRRWSGREVISPGLLQSRSTNDVMYIADTQAHRIRRYDPRTGMVTTVAGTWTAEDEAREQPLVREFGRALGDATASISAMTMAGSCRSVQTDWTCPCILMMESPRSRPPLRCRGLTVNGKGDIIFVDTGSHPRRSIDHRSGIISTIAGVCRVRLRR